MNNYYDILEIDIQASPETVKAAYRRLAKRYHPDTSSGDPEKFKLVTEAYDVLSDSEKRLKFDASLNKNSSLFPIPIYSLNIQAIAEITFLSLKDFQTKEVSFTRTVLCPRCSGIKDDSAICPKCVGRGKLLNPNSASYVSCDSCAATGKNLKNVCKQCHGEGTVKQEDRVSINIPAGVAQDHIVRIPGRGNQSSNLVGDLLVQVRIMPDTRWERKGNHVWSKVPVTYPQWVLGDTVEVETIWGREALKIPAKHDLMTPLTLPKQGLPNLKRLLINSSHERGDHFCFLDLTIPDLRSIDSEEAHYALLVELQRLYLGLEK